MFYFTLLYFIHLSSLNPCILSATKCEVSNSINFYAYSLQTWTRYTCISGWFLCIGPEINTFWSVLYLLYSHNRPIDSRPCGNVKTYIYTEVETLNWLVTSLPDCIRDKTLGDKSYYTIIHTSYSMSSLLYNASFWGCYYSGNKTILRRVINKSAWEWHIGQWTRRTNQTGVEDSRWDLFIVLSTALSLSTSVLCMLMTSRLKRLLISIHEQTDKRRQPPVSLVAGSR